MKANCIVKVENMKGDSATKKHTLEYSEVLCTIYQAEQNIQAMFDVPNGYAYNFLFQTQIELEPEAKLTIMKSEDVSVSIDNVFIVQGQPSKKFLSNKMLIQGICIRQ